MEAYDALVDEFAAPGELVHARQLVEMTQTDAVGCDLHITLAPKPGAPRKSVTR